ncbi:MAG: hypothetical protein JWM11_2635, partial [Planctomycetaceae bacterium]|nr:hypothetical protein [Planctomycetaceae bacterium]
PAILVALLWPVLENSIASDTAHFWARLIQTTSLFALLSGPELAPDTSNNILWLTFVAVNLGLLIYLRHKATVNADFYLGRNTNRNPYLFRKLLRRGETAPILNEVP